MRRLLLTLVATLAAAPIPAVSANAETLAVEPALCGVVGPRNRSNTEGILELASMTEERDVRICLLKRAVALRPSATLTFKILAHELHQSGEREDTLQAGKYLEQAYTQSYSKERREGWWYAASGAYGLYLEAGDADRAAKLRRRVRSDVGIPALQRVSDDDTADRIIGVFESLCSHYALPAIGPRDCLLSIGAVVDYLLSADRDARSRELADIAARWMTEAAYSARTLNRDDPDWVMKYRKWLDDLQARGFNSPGIVAAAENARNGLWPIMVD